MTTALRADLNWKLANPTKAFPAAASRIAIDAIDSGRSFSPFCAALGVAAHSERARRGSDGVAYLAIRYNCGQDWAFLALTEAEAAALGVASLADQQAKAKANESAASKASAANAAFLRDLDR